MREAAALVREHGFDLGGRQDDSIARLAQPVLPRVQREVRAVLAQHSDDPITDIHLVTWTAVVARSSA